MSGGGVWLLRSNLDPGRVVHPYKNSMPLELGLLLTIPHNNTPFLFPDGCGLTMNVEAWGQQAGALIPGWARASTISTTRSRRWSRRCAPTRGRAMRWRRWTAADGGRGQPLAGRGVAASGHLPASDRPGHGAALPHGRRGAARPHRCRGAGPLGGRGERRAPRPRCGMPWTNWPTVNLQRRNAFPLSDAAAMS